MSGILTVDIGAGTMDVLYFDVERFEHFKAVVRSPVAALAREVEATVGDLLIIGGEMGGGELDRLLSEGLAYPCTCSRKMLADVPRGPLGTIYPGTCRDGTDGSEAAIRLRTGDQPIEFEDRLQGPQSQRLESESGDFIIRRRDGLIAYHLAVVVDDHLQGITEIVRGIDLMDSTPRQIMLQRPHSVQDS